MEHNPYRPKLAEIIQIREETEGERPVKTFRLQFIEKNHFSFKCGQCAMLSVFGKGESMISISSSPLEKEYIQFSILKMGRVTTALHDMKEGDKLGIRGPYGNGFPVDEWEGKNLLFIGGGIGLAPIWSVLQTVLKKKKKYGHLVLFYGARSSADLVFKEELKKLKDEMKVCLSIDIEEPDWDEYVGFVPQNVLDKKPSSKNTVAVTCGPPIMIKFVIENLKKLGFKDNQIYTTVENKMKCGIGKCGRCNIGPVYICQEGPVFSWENLKMLPQEY